MAQPDRVRAHIGLTGQFAAIDDLLTGGENLELVGRLSHIGGRQSRRRATELLEGFDLTDVASRRAGTYSGGMRRRLDLAASLLAAPSILFLDEPTTGLDPRSRLAIWEVIADLVADGMTVLLTTQYLDEADHLADRIAIVDRGRVIASGTAAELKARVGTERVELTVATGSDIDEAARVLTPMGTGSIQIDRAYSRLTLPVTTGAAAMPALIRSLDVAGVRLIDIALRQPTLDDAFLVLTGHDVRRNTDQEVA